MREKDTADEISNALQVCFVILVQAFMSCQFIVVPGSSTKSDIFSFSFCGYVVRF